MTAVMDLPRLQLLDRQPINKGALVGRADLLLPCCLQISDIGIFQKDGRSWAQLPAEMMRDYQGQPLKDERGKARYRSALKWSNRELQDGFSTAVIGAIEAEHGLLLDGGAR